MESEKELCVVSVKPVFACGEKGGDEKDVEVHFCKRRACLSVCDFNACASKGTDVLG